MQTHITFKQLPFNPDSKNVIYIENEYDTEVNQYIQNNYNTIKEQFSHYGYNFIYMPLLVKDMEHKGVFSYYAPYLSQTEKESLNISSNWLLEYLTSPTKADIQPSLIFDGSFAAENTNTYYCIPILDYQYSQTNDFSELLNVILSQQDSMMCMSVDAFDIKEEEINNYNGFFEEENCLRQISTYEQEERRSTVKKSSESKQKEEKRNSVIFRRFKKGLDIIPGELFGSKASSKSEVCYDKAPIINPVPADYTFAEDSHALLDEVQKKIALLRQMGVNLAILEQLIHQEEKLSRMIITKKFDIILPDYNNMKIDMTPLCKALYILFLRYPEGIMFSYLPDYHDELLRIYTQIKDGYQTERMRKSIDKLTDPFDNSINEKCARIREAFQKQFEARLAQHYVVDGKRGEPKSIALPRNLVTWE